MRVAAKAILLRGALWMGSARIVVNLTSFASTIILARLLSPKDFGVVALATAASALVGSISELSLTQALVKFDSPDDDDFHSAWTLNLLRGGVICAVLIALSVPLALAYSEPRLISALAVVALASAFRTLENPRIVSFRRALDFRPDFLFDVIEKLVAFMLSVGLAVALRSYWALIISMAAGSLARLILTYIVAPYRPRLRLSRWRKLMTFSIWLTLAEIVKTINVRTVPLLTGAFLPTGAIGQFSLGERVAAMPIRESVGALQTILFPAFSRMADDLSRMRAAYVRAQAMTLLFALPMGFGLASVAEPLVLALIGTKWLAAVPIIQAVGISSSINAMHNTLALAMATNNTKAVFKRNIRELLIHIPLMAGGLFFGNLVGIGGLHGLGVALCISALANTFINLQLVCILIQSSLMEQMAFLIRPLVASVVMAAFTLAFYEFFEFDGPSMIFLIVLTIMGAFIYCVSILLMQVLFPNDFSAEREVVDLLKKWFDR